jgi:hypothetical protein
LEKTEGDVRTIVEELAANRGAPGSLSGSHDRPFAFTREARHLRPIDA